MNFLPSKKIRSSSHLLAISIMLSLVAIFGIYYSSHAQAASSHSSSSDPLSYLDACGVYPTVTLVHGNASSAVAGSSSVLDEVNQGSAFGPPFDNRGLPTTHLDNSDISLSLFRIAGGAPAPVIAATVTNTGKQVLNLTDFRMFGMTQSPSGQGWVGVLQAPAIDLDSNPTSYGKCTAPEPPATNAQSLSPGQSLTMYITGSLSWSYNGSPIDGFQARVNYSLPGSNLGYHITNDLTWTK
jgi:hypothetical protein